jgi:hypothetical protein
MCGRPAAMSCSKPEKQPSAAEEALWQPTPSKIRATFTNMIKHAAFWKLNAHLFYPAAGPNKELVASLADLDLWPRLIRECSAVAAWPWLAPTSAVCATISHAARCGR